MHEIEDEAPRDGFDVAIVGGGAAGTLVAIHLLRARRGTRVRIIEPRARLGEGAAYATRDPVHLLNVRASGMSAFEDDPGHFVRHLAASDHAGTDGQALAETFVPRRAFGGYLRETLAALAADPAMHVQDEAVAIERGDGYRVRLASGRTIEAAAVVLATGNAPRTLTADAAAVVRGWDYEAIAAIPHDADVGIIGAGLSMVDAVLALVGQGHRGRIRVLSRHGLLPLPHAPGRGPHDGVDALLGLGVRGCLRVLRDMVRHDSAEGRPWQWTMDRLRPHGRALWQSLAIREQRRFLRHVVRYWDIHRHRIAPEVHARLAGLLRGGQLEVQAGRVESIRTDATGVSVCFRPRGGTGATSMAADRLVVCAGIESRLSHLPGTLMPALGTNGIVAAGPHGLGLAVDDAGAAVDSDGHADPRLLTIGALRLGAEWETTAVPELRRQAAAIAERLLTTDAGRPMHV